MNKEKLKTLQTLTLFGSKFVVAYPIDWRIVNFTQTEPEVEEENILTEETAGDL